MEDTMKGIIAIFESNELIKAIKSESEVSVEAVGIQLLELLHSGNLINKFKCVNTVYDNNDVYKTATIDILMNNNIENCYNSEELVKEDIVSDKDIFSYIYDVDKNALFLYLDGEKKLKILCKDIELYKYVFENKELFHTILTFNKKSFNYDKDYYKEVRKLLRSYTTVDALERFLLLNDYKNVNKNNLYVEQFYASDDGSYITNISSLDYGRIAQFIIIKNESLYDIAINIFDVKITFLSEVKTKEKCLKEIYKILQYDSDKLVSLFETTELINNYIFKLKSNVDNMSQIVNDFETDLNKTYKSIFCRKEISKSTITKFFMTKANAIANP